MGQQRIDVGRFGNDGDRAAAIALEQPPVEANRARDYYRESAPLIAMIHPHSRASLKALIGIYSRLLDRIVASNYDVLTRRIRVPTWEKLWILAASKLK